MAEALGGWIEGAGSWGYLAGVVAMAVVAVLPFPAEVPALILGGIFGPIIGTVLTWCGAMIGATASFEIARACGRPALSGRISPETLLQVDRVASKAGVSGLLLLRLLPWIGFTAMNWGLGLTNLTRARFLWTTAVGILPGAALFTGSGAGFLRGVRGLPASVSMGLVSIAVVGWILYRARRKEGPPSGTHPGSGSTDP